jgi:hypothetical protein
MMNWYRIKTSLIGLKRLATLPEADKQACLHRRVPVLPANAGG